MTSGPVSSAGAAYFGTPPHDGLCPACRAGEGEP